MLAPRQFDELFKSTSFPSDIVVFPMADTGGHLRRCGYRAHSMGRAQYRTVGGQQLPIIRISSRGALHGGADGDAPSLQHPTALAGREARRKDTVVDLAGDGEPVECRRG